MPSLPCSLSWAASTVAAPPAAVRIRLAFSPGQPRGHGGLLHLVDTAARLGARSRAPAAAVIPIVLFTTGKGLDGSTQSRGSQSTLEEVLGPFLLLAVLFVRVVLTDVTISATVEDVGGLLVLLGLVFAVVLGSLVGS